MRFSCEHCGKKYVVKDELLPGRTYKSRCKVCGHIIVVKGDGVGAADDDAAVVPVPDTPSSTAVKAPTPPAARPPLFTPATPPPPRATPTPQAAAPAPKPPPTPSRPEAPKPPPREEAGYIDLFDGKGFDDPSPGFPNEPVRRVSATVIPPPAPPAQEPSETDPFLRAARAAHTPSPTPSPAPARPQQVAIIPSSTPPLAPPPRRMAPFLIGGFAAV